MQLDIYWTALLILLPAVVLLTGRNVIIRPFVRMHTTWQKSDNEEKPDFSSLKPKQQEKEHEEAPCTQADDEEVGSFQYSFLSVYLLVMSSEWLSGPYLYPLLRDDRALPESIVIGLYATAYISAAVSATVTGFLADRYGRRRAGMAQCGIHLLACLTVIFGGDCLPVLFVGRVLAGTALTMLWTVFESWMVTEWNARGLGRADGEEGGLGKMFGLMTTANCMAAVVGGVVGHCLVSVMASKLWPFWAGIALEGVAVVMMLRNWNENYSVKNEPNAEKEASMDAGSSRSRWFGDGRIWALTFVACCFEGTTFLIIFLWPSVLQHAHLARTGLDGPKEIPKEIPYGVIFAAFMAAMILGALMFNSSSQRGVSPVLLLMTGVIVAILSLFFLAILSGEIALFCAFLLFEVANGLYVPSMAYLRGLVVDEKSRTGMYGLMKIPLFVFVILALGITAEGSRFKHLVFASASLCLLLAAVALTIGFGLATMISNPKEPNYSGTEEVEVSVEEEDEDRNKYHEFGALSCGSQFVGQEVMMLEGV